MGEKGPNSYKKSAKAHANLFKKHFILLYLEDLNFCIKRAGWKVTKIHSHLTFDQEHFKRNFITMNQNSRQQAKDEVTKDFFKLMNNLNFGYDCRNNLDNCKFNPIFDELNEITNVNRYHSIFQKNMENFVSPEIIRQFTEEKFNDSIAKLDKNDPFYQIKYESHKNEYLAEIEAAQQFENKKRKNKCKMDLTDYSEQMQKVLRIQK